MRLLLLLVFVCFSVGFQHEAPGAPCVSNDIPEDGWPVVDYIFAGAGATSTVAASRLAELSDCSLDILMLEAGRSYTGAPQCNSPIDCYVQGVENDYHAFGALSTPQSTGTRSTWNYVTRPQVYSSAIVYSNSDVVDSVTCPYDTPDNIPAGCLCTSDRVNALTASCQVSRACLAATNNSVAACGTDACMPRTCGQNATNLYYRCKSKGGSNAHHAMVTYKMSPYKAGQWVLQTGDSRFSFANFEAAFQAMSSDWLQLNFVSNDFSPITTVRNDTAKALVGNAIVSTGEYHDLRDTTSDFIGDEAHLFNPANPDQKYFQGFLMDQLAGRQASRGGYRSSPVKYLDKMMARCGAAKFNATCNTYVTKILFNNNNQGRRAIGVEYIVGEDNFELDYNFNRTASQLRQQTPQRVYARRGVILGGGVFNTPQMLMLNGIGPEDHLAQFGIPVRKHLPAVGENLQDDVETTVHYHLTGADPLASQSSSPGFGVKPYFVPHPIKGLWGFNADAFDNTTGAPILPRHAEYTMCHTNAPAYGGRACPPGVVDDPAYLGALQNTTSFYREAVIATGITFTMFKDEVERLQRQNPTCMVLSLQGVTFNGWFDILYNYAGAFGTRYSFDVLGSDYKSRGTVRLRSNRTEDAPIVDTNTYSVPQDVEEHAKCVNQLRRIIDLANQLSTANPGTYGNIQLTEVPQYPLSPGASVPKDRYTPELGQWVKDATWHHHPQGTSRMGHSGDENSVVDSRGRVWGTTNLYVIDMSAIPEAVDMFPSTPAMALGYIQGTALFDNNAADGNICSAGQFTAPSRQLDTSSDSSSTTTIIVLGVFTGLFGAIAIVLSIVFLARSVNPGYTKISNKRN